MASLPDLPDELLNDILDYNVADSGNSLPVSLSLVCRRLRPLVQARMYQQIDLGGPKQTRRVALLAHAFALRPSAAALVGDLSVSLKAFTQKPQSKNGINTSARRLSGSPDEFFSSLSFSQLSRLDLSRVKVKVLVRLLSASLPSASPHLQSLSLEVYCGGPQNDEWFAHLSRLPNLRYLEVKGSRSALVLPPESPDLVALPQIESLIVPADVASPAFSASLTRLTPNLRHFTVNCGTSVQLGHLLTGAPMSLKTLSVSRFDCALEDHLGCLPHLKSLVVACSGSQPERLLRCLSSSGVSRLTFGRSSRPTDALLLAIADGPARMPFLRSLTLDSIAVGATGPELQTAFGDLDNLDAISMFSKIMSLSERLRPESLPIGCTLIGLARLQELASANSIEVQGPVLKLLDRPATFNWQADFEQQLARYLVNRTVATQDKEPMRVHYGGTPAAIILGHIRPDLTNPFAQ